MTSARMSRGRKGSVGEGNGLQVAESAAPSSSAKVRHAKANNDESKVPLTSVSNDSLPWSPVLAGKSSSVPIVFTPDGDFFFVAVSSAIRVYAVDTGRLVSTLSSSVSATDASRPSTSQTTKRQVPAHHTEAVTGLFLNPTNTTQLVSSSLDGSIKVWDYLDAQLLRSIPLNLPITHIQPHPTQKDKALVSVRKPRAKNDKDKDVNPFTYKGLTNEIIELVSFKTGARDRLGKARSVSDLAISADGRFGILVGKKKIHVAFLDEKCRQAAGAGVALAKLSSEQNITRVAFHPQRNTFATGHDNGQIRVWYFLNDSQAIDALQKGSSVAAGVLQLAPNTLLHWHAHAVSALRFSDNGALLLSGGEESTLVIWQLATQGREYVPRLGGSTIASVSMSGGGRDEFVTAMEDGSVVFIGSVNLKASRTLFGVLSNSSLRRTLMNHRGHDAARIPFSIEPATGDLVTMAGHPSSLQFLAVECDDAQTLQLEVVPSNRISRPQEAPLEQARVEHVCFHQEWMATVDRKASGEVTLKVWQWDARAKSYVVNTNIQEPHGQNCYVKSMCFSPRTYSSIGKQGGSPLLMTVGSDDKCRAWRLATQDNAKKGTSFRYWLARSAFDHRQSTIRGLAFSKDGSLLALAHERCVSLWDPEANEQIHVAPFGNLSEKGICHLTFVGNGGGRFMAFADERTFFVYDIVLGAIAYCAPVQQKVVGLLALTDDQVAIVSSHAGSTSAVTLFSTQSSKPLSKRPLPFGVQKVTANAAYRDEQKSSTTSWAFYALTSKFDVLRIANTAERAAVRIQRGRQASTLQRAERSNRSRRGGTLYDELLGVDDVLSVPQEETKDIEQLAKPDDTHAKPSHGDASSIFDVPAHLLPPIHLLFDPFVSQILPAPSKDVQSSTLNAQDNGMPNENEDEAHDEQETTRATTETHGAQTSADRMAQIAAMDMSKVTELFASMSSDSPAHSAMTNGTQLADPEVKTNGKISKHVKETVGDDSIASIMSASSSSDKKKSKRQKKAEAAAQDLADVSGSGKKRKNAMSE